MRELQNKKIGALTMSTDTALLVIDVQVGLIEASYRSTEVLEHINTLLEQAHNSHSPVIYIQHDEPEGHELEVGTAAWEIHPAIAPKEGDVIIHKRASDSFHKTTLQQELERQHIKQLVVVGGQTEYCVDTTCRRATTLGYNVTLVGDAHTTVDYDGATITAAQRIDYHNEVLDGFRTDDSKIVVKKTNEVDF
jgi:nicotinamidase-related amidase